MTEVAMREPRVNEQIIRFHKELPKVTNVRLVGENGEQQGIVPVQKALVMARESGFDLVEVAPMAQPPVCKIVDYGKYKYQQAKRLREAQAAQKVHEVKTLAFGPMIDDHDLLTKINSANKFLIAGDKVRIVIKFKGRQITHPEFAKVICDKIIEATAEKGHVEKTPLMDGKAMLMILAPK